MKKLPSKVYLGELSDGSLAVCNDEYAVEYVRSDLVKLDLPKKDLIDALDWIRASEEGIDILYADNSDNPYKTIDEDLRKVLKTLRLCVKKQFL